MMSYNCRLVTAMARFSKSLPWLQLPQIFIFLFTRASIWMIFAHSCGVFDFREEEPILFIERKLEKKGNLVGLLVHYLLWILTSIMEVVAALARSNLMVILDNQLSKPGWCCSRYDGNGFFGDEYLDTNEWLSGLKIIATMFTSTPNVVGMSLRNELRGPNQNLTLWYRADK